MKEKALVFIAHPDDEAFMSGTIVKLVDRGVDVRIVSVTDGGAGYLPHARKEEAQEAGKILGVSSYDVLDFYDGEFYASGEAITILAQKIKETQPQLVFTHTDDDYHGDHRPLLETVRRALERADAHHVALYTMDPQGLKNRQGQIEEAPIVVSLTESEMQRRLAAFRAHASQLIQSPPEGEFDYVQRSRREGIVRGVQINAPYGEGFRQVYGDFTLTSQNTLQEILGSSQVHVFAG